jgi:antitoxin HigA-1
MKIGRACTPGDMLKHEFLAEYGLSQNELAQFFGNSAEFWMNLQSWYDLKTAAKELPASERRRIVAARAA